MITYLVNKFKGWLAILGAVIVAVLYAYAKGRRGGVRDAAAEANRKTEKVQQKFDKIDSSKPDFDRAIGKLRDRSRKG